MASIYAVAMFSSIKLALVKKSISLFTRNLRKSQQSTVQLCLKLIAFGTSSTLVAFGEKYFDYCEKGIRTKVLAIGGYKSAFIAELVASYPFEKFNN